ncbi:LysR substrate-binding domain-containing protein [Glutamicibacter protophormiae]|uniref:DNA-binding transcriptional LysR family regulator n=1 Tax=Glutamicibacter protophormiae TaxID=37930 RepID=A0ABS4XL00_GLUPR|nr:LysR substrate-binding domain-containing protein [Glutamicibacter protophormiae]MBP2397173.1 DNA-binding transcriptional LysR family regulator [Glutamicibacter protophormiae]GGM00137.1 LysR family transcriptional regulator [Glutamicibacter protophormiae]
MLELRRLRLLRELSIRGTIAEVADVLSYSPSSVSQQLTQLEAEAGVELLRRTGRTLQLTPQAQVLVAHTEELLDSMERAEAALAATLSTVTGTVRLAVFQTAMLALMPPVLRELRTTHPQLRVEMSQQEPAEALHETNSRNFDLVVAEQYPGHAAPHYENLDRRVLTHDAIRLALPARGAAGNTEFDRVTALEHAAHLPWVMEPDGAASRHWAEQSCRLAGFEPDVRYETADLQAHLQLVASGNAVAMLPALVLRTDSGSLRAVELPGAPMRTIFTAMRHSSAQSPAMQAVRSLLHRQPGMSDEQGSAAPLPPKPRLR